MSNIVDVFLPGDQVGNKIDFVNSLGYIVLYADEPYFDTYVDELKS